MSAGSLGSLALVAGFGFWLLARSRHGRARLLFNLPAEVYRIARDPQLRRNHALEHATLNVLERRHGRPQLTGHAVANGFLLRGWVNPAQIAAAAAEGLAGLRAGRRNLAYHPHCGTSLGTAELLTWVVLGLLLVTAGRLTPWAIALAIAATWVAAPFAGRLVQRWLTTSPAVDGLAITGVTFRPLPPPAAGSPASPADLVWGEVLVLLGPAAAGPGGPGG